MAKAHEPKVDYTCWKCHKEVLPQEVKKDSNRTRVYCPHCNAEFICGFGRWVRPFSTLTPEEKSQVCK